MVVFSIVTFFSFRIALLTPLSLYPAAPSPGFGLGPALDNFSRLTQFPHRGEATGKTLSRPAGGTRFMVTIDFQAALDDRSCGLLASLRPRKKGASFKHRYGWFSSQFHRTHLPACRRIFFADESDAAPPDRRSPIIIPHSVA
ncbi:GCN5 family acetyltransferase [Anopheles sinensis]|uniref:GCN5 family acetyltransferase n=1 Tax=Anopheles sinensis TaxID=74873 RepID=A0A084WQD2_ANOSI|nr:GCN5 family acetyltransferase [Anopheles sinensis]